MRKMKKKINWSRKIEMSLIKGMIFQTGLQKYAMHDFDSTYTI